MINVKEEIVYQGYFFEDHFHGLGLYKTAAEIFEGEFLNGRLHGKSTDTNSTGLYNTIRESGKVQAKLRITSRPDQAFYRNGMAVKSLQKVIVSDKSRSRSRSPRNNQARA